MKLFFLTFLLALSCTKNSPLNIDSAGTRLTDVSMEFSHLNETEWAVGIKKDSVLSQSFYFTVSLPKVSESDLEKLSELKNIDAWIVRLVTQRGSTTQDLGSLYTYFRPKKFLRGHGRGAPSSVALKVYYAAAYPSERFRFFKCPAFGHNKKISAMKITGEKKNFDIVIGQVTSYPEKSQLVELRASSFNGGLSLIGEYFVEIAPYDSKNKVIHGPFNRLAEHIEVTDEESVNVPSCLGVHQERD
jgi:hypothetical protein